MARPTQRGEPVRAVRPVDAARGEFWVPDPFSYPRTQNLSAYEPNQVLLNLGGFRFLNLSRLTAAGSDADCRGALAGDLDGDLAPDLVIRNVGGGPVRVYLNRFPARGRLTVSLRGVASNRPGIGARVVAEVGGRRITRQVLANNTFTAQQLPRARFGLGDADRVERLTVHWPSGAVQVLDDVAAGRHVRITEGVAAPEVISAAGGPGPR